MKYLEIDKSEYTLGEIMVVTIYPGTYIDTCFGLHIKNIDTDKAVHVEEFSVCADAITTVDKTQTRKISLNSNYQAGNHIISITPNGENPISVKFTILTQ